MSAKPNKVYTITVSFQMKASDIKKMVKERDPDGVKHLKEFFSFLDNEPTDVTEHVESVYTLPEPEEAFNALWEYMRDYEFEEEDEPLQPQSSAEKKVETASPPTDQSPTQPHTE